MCGIIGYVGPKDAKEVILDGLRRLEYRGYDSAGFAVREHGKTELFRAEGRIDRLAARIGDRTFPDTLGVGHTRWATHGAPTERNAHPHRVGHVTLVHNGIIENWIDLKAEILASGREVASDTDSELVAHLIDEAIGKGRTLEAAVYEVVPRLRGAYAFVLMSDLEPDLLVGVRNGPPLLAALGDGENFLASDVQAILHRTRRIVYLRDHEIALCRKGAIEFAESNGQRFVPEVRTLDWSQDQVEKGGYEHFMLKEIFEQPAAIANTIEGHVDHERGLVKLDGLPWTDAELRAIDRIDLAACGTARHAALVGKYFLERFARIPTEVDFASEFRYRDPLLEKKNLLVCVSQSGETADTLAALREGKRAGVHTLAICNVRHSSLTREAEATLYTNAGPEIGVASTKAFTTQLVVLYLLAVHLGHLRGVLSEDAARELTQDLLALPVLVEGALEGAAKMQETAAKLDEARFFFFLGRDLQYPVAQEGALKLKEITYLPAEGYPAGEIKHGPIALIDAQTAVVVLSPRDRRQTYDMNERFFLASETRYEKMVSNLLEAKSRGGRIVAIGAEGDTALAGTAELYLGLPPTTWAQSAIVTAVPMQLLAYYVACRKGTDVDKPRNLAKSVTVE